MTDRRSARGSLVGALAAIVLVAACAPGPTPTASSTATSSAIPSPTGSPSSSPADSAAPTPTGAALRVYLLLGFGGQAGLVPVARATSDGSATPEAAMRALLGGPTDIEAGARPAIYTAIPGGVELLGLTLDGDVATVDLSDAFEAATDDLLPTSMRLAQVVYTLTSFPGIESVGFKIEGRLVTLIGPAGLEFSIDRPLDRLDLLKALPPLFVDQPAWGGTITSPVHVAGLANAFEATFELRIADAEGRGVAAWTVTATCGTGCWGEFGVDVPFSISAGGPGVLQVFEESAKDGARLNLREYAVTLVP